MNSVFLKLVFISIAFYLMPSLSTAQSTGDSRKTSNSNKPNKSNKSNKEEKKNYWPSKVRINQAVVYIHPSFDSPIITYLPIKKTILVFANPQKGPGNVGLFYRIKYENRKYGYIVDTDIRPTKKSSNNIFKDNDYFIPQEDQEGVVKPIYLTRYIGLLYGEQLFSETIDNKLHSAKTSFIGAKISGPGLLGFPTEFNISFSKPPSYYKKLIGPTSGFTIMSDISITLPLIQKRDFLIYYGAGIVALFNNFKVKITKPDNAIYKGKVFGSQEVRIGGVLPIGLTLRHKKLAFKLEGKFVVEEERYFSWLTSLQWDY